MTTPSEFVCEAGDGTRLFGVIWGDEHRGKPRAVVQIAHGMAEHIRRYHAFAERLVRHGVMVYGHDHRGHGRTASEGGCLGYFADENGFETVVGDMVAVTQQIQDKHPGVPVFLFGHSMGSSLSLRYMQLYGQRLAGVILSGSGWFSNLQLALGEWLAAREVRRMGRRAPSHLLHQLTFGGFNRAFRPTRTEMDWLSRDVAEVDKYLADPLCGNVHTAGFFHDYFHGLRVLQRPAEMARIPKALPVLLISGADDPVGNRGRGVQRLAHALRRAGVNDVRLRLYPGARHELLNETCREEVWADVLNWLEERLTHHVS